jgi:hypothetical protein
MLPPFMYDMDEYMRSLDEIAETNLVEDCDPELCIKLPTLPKPPQEEDPELKEDDNSYKSEEGS